MGNAKNRLGVFDSGIGGVTVLKEILKTEVFDDIIYFGDTGRVPYGTRSPETIINYARQDVRFLCEQKVGRIVIACGTVSAIAIDTLKKEFDIPVTGVIDTAIEAAVKATKNGIIGVIGTNATINNGAYERNIKRVDSSIKTVSTACPLFVPLVEYGFSDDKNEVTKLVCSLYLKPIIESGADTVIMGCTHYPMIANIIRSCFDKITLIDVGTALAHKLADEVTADTFATVKSKSYLPKIKYFVSDDVKSFRQGAEMFLGLPYSFDITQIDIQKY